MPQLGSWQEAMVSPPPPTRSPSTAAKPESPSYLLTGQPFSPHIGQPGLQASHNLTFFPPEVHPPDRLRDSLSSSQELLQSNLELLVLPNLRTLELSRPSPGLLAKHTAKPGASLPLPRLT